MRTLAVVYALSISQIRKDPPLTASKPNPMEEVTAEAVAMLKGEQELHPGTAVRIPSGRSTELHPGIR